MTVFAKSRAAIVVGFARVPGRLAIGATVHVSAGAVVTGATTASRVPFSAAFAVVDTRGAAACTVVAVERAAVGVAAASGVVLQTDEDVAPAGVGSCVAYFRAAIARSVALVAEAAAPRVDRTVARATARAGSA